MAHLCASVTSHGSSGILYQHDHDPTVAPTSIDASVVPCRGLYGIHTTCPSSKRKLAPLGMLLRKQWLENGWPLPPQVLLLDWIMSLMMGARRSGPANFFFPAHPLPAGL